MGGLRPRRKLSKAELREQVEAAFRAWRAGQTSKVRLALKARKPEMSKQAMREESERLVKEALERKTLTVRQGKARIDSKCRKCGALNRVSAAQGKVRREESSQLAFAAAYGFSGAERRLSALHLFTVPTAYSENHHPGIRAR